MGVALSRNKGDKGQGRRVFFNGNKGKGKEMTPQSQHPIENLRQRYEAKINQLDMIFNTPDFLALTGLSEEETPGRQITKFFNILDTVLLDADNRKYRQAFLNFVTELNCFKLHVFDQKRPQRLWNPLDEEFDVFIKKVKTPDYHVSETPNPPTEVILQWLES